MQFHLWADKAIKLRNKTKILGGLLLLSFLVLGKFAWLAPLINIFCLSQKLQFERSATSSWIPKAPHATILNEREIVFLIPPNPHPSHYGPSFVMERSVIYRKYSYDILE